MSRAKPQRQDGRQGNTPSPRDGGSGEFGNSGPLGEEGGQPRSAERNGASERLDHARARLEAALPDPSKRAEALDAFMARVHDEIAHATDTRQVRRASWVRERGEQETEWKTILSHYAATHFVRWHGMVLQLATGTQALFLMDAILRNQVDSNRTLDLSILTTSLDILEKGLEERSKHPDLFYDSMQINLTGGSFHSPTHSLVGGLAARIADITPDAVFFGAKGVNFQPAGIVLRYQYEVQLETQKSFATRPTKHRVVIFDHTKLGDQSAFPLALSAEDMLANADRCTFITSWPYDDVEQRRIVEQEKVFSSLVEKVQRNTGPRGKTFRLMFIDSRGDDVTDRRANVPGAKVGVP